MASQPLLEILIVGPGRLGRTAHHLLCGGGHRVSMVGRGESVPSSPLTWITVPDREIPSVAAEVPRGGVVLHASGSLGIEVLRPHPAAGSLHPLMTFPGPEHALPPPDSPAAVAGDPTAQNAALALAKALGFRPFVVPGDRRLYHAAAVMAGNFATALLHDAAQVLTAAGVPEEDAASLLAPLALASIHNAAIVGPAAALTGPIARGDEAVIAAHHKALANLPASVRQTYTTLLAATRALADSGESQ